MLRILRLQIMCVVLTACSLFTITKKIEVQDIVGIWIENRENCKTALSLCARFEFMEDGSFKARNISSFYFGYFGGISNVNFDASGTWEIQPTSDPLGDHIIRLHFDPVAERHYPKYTETLYAESEADGFDLFTWAGDPTDRIEFIKLSEKDVEKQP